MGDATFERKNEKSEDVAEREKKMKLKRWKRRDTVASKRSLPLRVLLTLFLKYLKYHKNDICSLFIHILYEYEYESLRVAYS